MQLGALNDLIANSGNQTGSENHFQQSQVSDFSSEHDSKTSMPIRLPEKAEKTHEIEIKKDETNDRDVEIGDDAFNYLEDKDFENNTNTEFLGAHT